ncbi:hypothetical protein PMAC_002208 [Pneumocystis sp. 'macacae']|nr:hypothetical protein PMAC_002208 [Pneumocystis sp. 'macacae']
MHNEHKNTRSPHHDTIQYKEDTSTKMNNQKGDTSVKNVSQNSTQNTDCILNQQSFPVILPSQHPITSPFTSHTTSFPSHNIRINTYPTNSSTSPGYAEITAPGFIDSQFSIFPQFYGNISLPSNIPKLGRTVYIGNIPSETTVNEILSQVKTGPIESVRLLPDKNCAFISFLDTSPAALFYEEAIIKKLNFHGKEAKIGWGKPSSISSTVMLAVQQSGATRNVYLGNLPENITEEEIREDLSKFGTIDQIKIIKNKGIGFVHFLSISNAMKAVQQLPMEHKWSNRKISYGKDRCAQPFKQQSTVSQDSVLLSNFNKSQLTSQMAAMNLIIPNYPNYQDLGHSNANSHSIIGNRTVYLGNIHPETTIEEICNIVRGGILHQIKYFREKHICFVTFISPASSILFYNVSIIHGLIIHNRKIKVGFGKHSGLLPSSIAIAVASGATRNIYIGNINENITIIKLKKDFSQWGETELINILKEKNCAFVNFTNIEDAIKAIEGIKSKEDYKKFRISFGKDRCGNLPKQIISHSDKLSLSQPKTPHTSYNIFHPIENPYTTNIVETTHPEQKFQNEIPYYTNFPPNKNNDNINADERPLSPLLYNSIPYNDASTNNNNQLTYGIIFNYKQDETKQS